MADIQDDPFGADAVNVEDPFGAAEGADNGGDIDDAFGLGGGDSAVDDNMGYGDLLAEDTSGADAFGLDAPADAPVESPLAQQEASQEALEQAPAVSDKFREWEENRAIELKAKREKAYADKEAQEETAKADLVEFYKERNDRIERAKAKNEEEEKKSIADRASVAQFGSTWEKVEKIIDLKPKPNEKPGLSKVDRMRSLLIQLKNEKATP